MMITITYNGKPVGSPLSDLKNDELLRFIQDQMELGRTVQIEPGRTVQIEPEEGASPMYIPPLCMNIKSLSEYGIYQFIEKARSQYYADHNNAEELCKNMGKAIAYTEVACSLNYISTQKAHQLVKEAEDVLNEVCYYEED